MSARVALWLAWSLLALSLLFGVLGCLLWLSNSHPPSGDTWYTLAFLAFPLVGVVIASRRPENPIGWLFCIIGLANGLFFFSDEYVIYALATRPGVLPGGVWLAWSQLWTVFIMWSLMFFSLLLFPTGRLPSPRWRPVAWGLAGVFTFVTVLFLVKPGPLEGITPVVVNPTGIEAAAGIVRLGENAVLPVVLIIVLAAPAAVLVRFWHSRGEERQQLKWLAYAAGLWVVVAALDALNQSVLREPAIDYATAVLFGAAVAPIPVAVGIAILRYRLYDIDVIINRTLVYSSLTTLLVATYFGVVVLLQGTFRALTGQESQLAIVASTLLIAALFVPLRRQVQSFIDRRFYRKKYDAVRTLQVFSTKLREKTDLDTLDAELLGVVRETVQPAHASLWLRPASEPDRERAVERSR
jgi:hypothetical protein